MAFPQVEGTATSVEASATTSHTVSLPSSIVSGELLVVWFGVEHSSDSTVAWPGGWTPLDETFNVEFEGAVAYKIASGSEGSDITVTSGQSKESGHVAFRISGNTSNAPEIGVATNTNLTNHADPPDLTPSWGTKDTLWLASAMSTAVLVASAPTFYTDQIKSGFWGTSEVGQVSVAERELAASSENPSFFSLGANAYGISHTLAIEPVPPLDLVLRRVSSMHFQRKYQKTSTIGE